MVNALADKIAVEILTDALKKRVRWSTVGLSEVLNGGLRLESSYFNIDGKHAREIVKNSKWNRKALCGEVAFTNGYKPERFKRIFVEKSEFPILQPSQICEILPKPRIFLSPATKTQLDKLRAKKCQILITRSGTIGNVTFISRTLDNQICSDDLIRLTATNEVDSGYVYAFLKTKTGNTLINTNNYGAVVQHIEPEHLESVVIPDPDLGIKKEINKLILDSFNLRDQSNDLIREAEELLISELKLPMLDEFNPKYLDKKSGIRGYEVKLSKLEDRLEAANHLPIVNTILKHLNKYAEEVTTLGDNRISQDIILPGRFKRIYVEEREGIKFLGGRDIFQLDPDTDKYISIKRHENEINKSLLITENCLIIPSRGTIGRVMLAPKHYAGWAISDNLIKLIASNLDLIGYVYAFLDTDYGNILIKRLSYGGVVYALEPQHVKTINVPLLKNKNTQKKINDFVLEANQKRYNAYLLEQQAISMVNNLVLNQPEMNEIP